jgi:hypothetical protein
VFAKELALSLVRLELGSEMADVNDPADLGAQVLRELVGDCILVPALGVRCY